MKSVINPETGELVWEGETEAEKAQAEKANKAAAAAPLEALAKAFGETEAEAETKYFVFREGESFPLEIIPCTENEALDCFDNALVVEVTGDPEIGYEIEAMQWWAGEGVCRLTVNFFPLETALRIFGETVKAFVKAESEKPQG